MSTAVLIVAIVFGAIFLRHWLDTEAQQHRERLRLMEKAIDSGQLDRKQLDELTAALTGRKPRPRDGDSLLQRICVGAGWIGLFVGIAVFAVGQFGYDRDATISGIVIAVISFGVVTFPFALREYDARRAPESN